MRTIEMLAVSLTNRMTFTTTLARIGRRDLLDGYAGQLRLLLDLQLKIIVRPIVSILTRIRFALVMLQAIVSDAAKIFQPNAALMPFGETNYLFADDVIDMPTRAPFFTLNLLHCAHLAGSLQS